MPRYELSLAYCGPSYESMPCYELPLAYCGPSYGSMPCYGYAGLENVSPSQVFVVAAPVSHSIPQCPRRRNGSSPRKVSPSWVSAGPAISTVSLNTHDVETSTSHSRVFYYCTNPPNWCTIRAAEVEVWTPGKCSLYLGRKTMIYAFDRDSR